MIFIHLSDLCIIKYLFHEESWWNLNADRILAELMQLQQKRFDISTYNRKYKKQYY